ncbi:hypothetical protein [Actinoplanes auranticolor]|uniref:DUF4367 domain-containing protein n=1 Tax=Actinoplanes auranticolor TaxID=47988 RepID=A0A919VPI4_9ACTN|nr:hypothetical protein [Actinoplanes auranticolor]GIM71172.1 hypothetical protein Aau02nite_44660 [Actinoplanes auranticolor]
MPDDLDDLARELRALATHLDVPPAADQRAAVRARLARPAPRRRWFPAVAVRPLPGRRWIVAVVAALIALVAGIAPARAAVVDAVGGLLRIAGIEVRQEPAPGGLPADPSPLPSVRTGSLEDARRVALFPVLVPDELGGPERVDLGDPDPSGAPRVVTLVYRGGAVRLDEFDGRVGPSFFKSAPEARWTDVAGADAIWLPQPHPVTYVGRDGVERTATARLAGPTLIWTSGGLTYRLEGLADLEEARTVAVSLR